LEGPALVPLIYSREDVRHVCKLMFRQAFPTFSGARACLGLPRPGHKRMASPALGAHSGRLTLAASVASCSPERQPSSPK
jgi:hypothetical protein